MMKIFSKLGYHSSPYEFDKFENKVPDERAKTGEGAMVHGYGLYIQGDKTINTQRYKDRLSGIPLVDFGNGWINGKDLVMGVYYQSNPDEYDRIYKCWDIISNMWSSCKREGYSIGKLFEEGLDKFKEYMNRWIDVEIASNRKEQLDRGVPMELVDRNIQEYRDAVDLLKGIKMNKITQYTVEIPDDMVFAEEDDEFFRQPRQVQEAMEKQGINKFQFSGAYDDDTFEDFYRENAEFDNGYYISNFLLQNGVDGIHYDGGMDGECWVIFNCEKLKIISKE